MTSLSLAPSASVPPWPRLRRSIEASGLSLFHCDAVSQLTLRLAVGRIAYTLIVAGALGSAWADWDDDVAAYAAGDYATAYRE